VADDAEAEVVGEGSGRWAVGGGQWGRRAGGDEEFDFVGVGQKRGDFVLMRAGHWRRDASGTRSRSLPRRCDAREFDAVEDDLGVGGKAGADEPEGVVVFEAGGAMKDARPARGSRGEAVALPRVAEPKGVGEEHGRSG
jgi:hypothetical protein